MVSGEKRKVLFHMNGLCESEYEIVSIVTKTFFNQAAFSPKNAQYTHLRDKKNNTHQTI